MSTETPRPDRTMALNMRQNASRGTNGICPVCGDGFNKKRAWHAFCSPKCRKTAWIINHRAGISADIRIDIAAIKADVAAIMKIIGDVWSASIKAKAERWNGALAVIDKAEGKQ